MSEYCNCRYADCAVCGRAEAERERDEWREKAERLEKERDDANLNAAYEQTRRQLAEENAAKELEFRSSMEQDWAEIKIERDRLRAAVENVRDAMSDTIETLFPPHSIEPFLEMIEQALKGSG